MNVSALRASIIIELADYHSIVCKYQGKEYNGILSIELNKYFYHTFQLTIITDVNFGQSQMRSSISTASTRSGSKNTATWLSWCYVFISVGVAKSLAHAY